MHGSPYSKDKFQIHDQVIMKHGDDEEIRCSVSNVHIADENTEEEEGTITYTLAAQVQDVNGKPGTKVFPKVRGIFLTRVEEAGAGAAASSRQPIPQPAAGAGAGAVADASAAAGASAVELATTPSNPSKPPNLGRYKRPAMKTRPN